MGIARGPRLPISGCPDNPAPAQLTTEAAPPGPVAEQMARCQCAGTGVLKKSARRLLFRRPGEHRPPAGLAKSLRTGVGGDGAARCVAPRMSDDHRKAPMNCRGEACAPTRRR